MPLFKKLIRNIAIVFNTLLGTQIRIYLIKALKYGLDEKGFKKAFGFPPDLLKVPAGHFYSVYPDKDSVKARWIDLFGRPKDGIKGIDHRLKEQLALAAALEPFFADFPYDFNEDEKEVCGYYNDRKLRYRSIRGNVTFHVDAVVLQAMLRHYKPKRVVEIGSGYSSAVMLDTREINDWKKQELTFIEPYLQNYFFPILRKEDRDYINLIEKPIWEVKDEIFTSLEAGDLLFIDSSHVAKIGSDVHHYLFKIFPLLKPGVIIHLHDITAYYEMAECWFNAGRYWNEGAFIRAFMMYNGAFEVLFHSHLLLSEHGDKPGLRTLHAQKQKKFKLDRTQWSTSYYLRKR